MLSACKNNIITSIWSNKLYKINLFMYTGWRNITYIVVEKIKILLLIYSILIYFTSSLEQFWCNPTFSLFQNKNCMLFPLLSTFTGYISDHYPRICRERMKKIFPTKSTHSHQLWHFLTRIPTSPLHLEIKTIYFFVSVTINNIKSVEPKREIKSIH